MPRREFLMFDRVAARHNWHATHHQYVRCVDCGAEAEIYDGSYYLTYPSSILLACEDKLPSVAEVDAVAHAHPIAEVGAASTNRDGAPAELLLEADTHGIRLRFSPDTDPAYVASVFKALWDAGQSQRARSAGSGG